MLPYRHKQNSSENWSAPGRSKKTDYMQDWQSSGKQIKELEILINSISSSFIVIKGSASTVIL